MLRISIEGLDGSGKSTQAQKLVEWLQAQEALAVTAYHEPRSIRQRIFDYAEQIGKVEGRDDVHLSYLYGIDGFHNRFEELAEAMSVPADKQEQVIVRDRDTAISQYAYHHNLGTHDQMLFLTSYMVNGVNGTDLVIYVDVPVDVCLPRIEARAVTGKKKFDYYEKKEKLDIIRSNYLELIAPGAEGDAIRNLMGFEATTIVKVDGVGSVEEVFARVLEVVKGIPMIKRLVK